MKADLHADTLLLPCIACGYATLALQCTPMPKCPKRSLEHKAPLFILLIPHTLRAHVAMPLQHTHRLMPLYPQGMAVFDTMRHIRPDVSTCCIGLAASMGAFILASGQAGKRYSLPNSRIMIHQPLGGAQGQATDIEIQANEILHHKLTLNGYLVRGKGATCRACAMSQELGLPSRCLAKGLEVHAVVCPSVPGPASTSRERTSRARSP